MLEKPTSIIRKSLLSPARTGPIAQGDGGGLGTVVAAAQAHQRRTVVVNTITPPLWFPLARLAGRKVFCHLHEAESQVNPTVRWAMYLPLQFCTGVVANSAYTRKVLAESSIGLVGRTAIVHNTVPGPASVTPPRNELDGDVRLLYVGRLSHRKGIQVAVSAMDLLRRRGIDTRLDIVGAVFPATSSTSATSGH